MRQMASEREAEPGAEPSWDAGDHAFEAEGRQWTARVAGSGAYGTGHCGTARLVAIHFCHEDDPDTPRREALAPAASFPYLSPEELTVMLRRATPIETDRTKKQ